MQQNKGEGKLENETKLDVLSNVIGDRGEMIFELAITDYRDFQRPLFRPGFLGEKWPTIDYYVELLGIRDSTPYFLAQIKTTTAPIPAGATILSISMEKSKCNRLFKMPGPTYIIGVHEPTQRAFILSVHHKVEKGIYQIPLNYELDSTNLKLLHEEVALFWKSSPRKPRTSHFE